MTTFPSLLGKEPKKNHLMTVLHSIKYKWNIIGEQLEVPYADRMYIMSAGSNLPYDDTRKLSEVLQVWIDTKSCEVSWRTIITVIDDPPVDEKRVADEIHYFLAKPEIMNEYLLSNQLGKIKLITIDKIIL